MASQLVVIDEGSAQAVATFERDGKVVTLIVPSRAEDKAKVQISGYSPSSYFTEEGDEYTVNANLDDTVPTYVPSYQTSTANRAIIHETLRVSGFAGKKVRVCVTLPVGRYFGNGSTPRNEKLIEAKRKNTMAGITAANGAATADIIECGVYPEALPALFDLTRKKDGSLKEGFNENDKNLVVDVGGSTTDITVVTPGGDIQAYDSILNCGVLDIAEELSTSLTQRFDLKAKLPSSVLDQILRKGQFLNQDIGQEIKQASRKVQKTILSRLEKLVPNHELLDNVMVVGGGALLLGEDLADQLVLIQKPYPLSHRICSRLTALKMT